MKITKNVQKAIKDKVFKKVNGINKASMSIKNEKLIKLLETPIFHLKVKIETRKKLILPNYGPMMRNWIKSQIIENKIELQKNPENSDNPFQPYFFYATHEHNTNELTIHLLFQEKMRKEAEKLITCLAETEKLHVGGIEANISEVKINKKYFEFAGEGKKLEIELITPLSIKEKGKRKLYLTLKQILDALVRSINRYNKFYMKKCYPIYWEKSWEKQAIETIYYDAKIISWKQRRRTGKPILMEGIKGKIIFELEEENEELQELIKLTKFYQIGKRTAYGFGKIKGKFV